jgi:predicted Zn-dependent peptidase
MKFWRCLFYIFILTFCVITIQCGGDSHRFDSATLENGLQVVISSRKAPVSAAVLCLRSSSFLANPDLTRKTADLLLRGTEVRNQNQILDQLESLGGRIGAYVSLEKVFLYVQAPQENFLECFKIFYECLTQPSFDESIINKGPLLIQRTNLFSVGTQYSYQKKYIELMLEMMYDIPGRWDSRGEKKKAISREELLGFYNAYFRPERAALAVVGPVDKTVLSEVLSQNWNSSRASSGGDLPGQSPLHRLPPSRKEHLHKGTEDIVMLGYPAPGFEEENSLTAWLFTLLLATGESSVIPNQLREQGLYNVTARTNYITGQGLGFIMVTIMAPSDKGEPAMRFVTDVFEDLKSNGIPEEAVTIAKRKFRSALLNHFQYSRHFATHLAARTILQHPVKDYPSLMEAMDKVSAQEMQGLAVEIMKDPTVLVIR